RIQLSSSPGAVAYPGPSPDPEKEISTIRLLREGDSWLGAPDRDQDPRSREREIAKQVREPLPGETLALAPTAEPRVPGAPRLLEDEQQTSEVAAHREVVEVALDAPRERLVLNRDRQVSVAATPTVDGLDDPSQARTACLAEHPPTSFAGPRPV